MDKKQTILKSGNSIVGSVQGKCVNNTSANSIKSSTSGKIHSNNAKNTINKISSMNNKDKRLSGLSNAKLIYVSEDRQCRLCKRIIHTGEECITSKETVNKKGMTYREVSVYASSRGMTIDELNKIESQGFKNKRTWTCKECSNNIVREDME